MALWFCSWPERTSFVVDHSKKSEAIRLAAAAAEGERPTACVAIPDGFVSFHVVDESSEADPDAPVMVEWDDTVLDVLTGFEDADDGAPPAATVPRRCQAEAFDADHAVIQCELPELHTGDHEHGTVGW